ncbi:YbaK/EbsC family protein [Marihabitans asiaticum]|uniref:Prolyl-tRNA editing enzyme YbaK/EbsC (Cys-tRNA(Pro) deacylase) n=1 Tax=Marihabitans asiaticum TaxID=415218 RepID=A0A560WF07_9MICO|nr:YbaK/EbsC family protein [Marihabitans asiaticum]TWD16075.1 prolyl-tRNA editing enzyme YbaK/EbsC (Cys-tRNA(Pro) deacylase) [Marihabitans asiaticum]
MSFERARDHLAGLGLEGRILTFDVPSATVDQAAAAVGVAPERIAKSLTFLVHGAPVLVVVAGDARVDNPAFKATFGAKASMLGIDQAPELIGYPVGGVCPFAVAAGVRVCLDKSLRRFETVYPACGDAASAVELTLPELERASGSTDWVSVTRLPGS